MKSFVPVFLIAVFFLSSCNAKKESAIVVNRIQYDVPVINEDPDVNWWVNNMEGSKREVFLKEMFEKAGSGEVTAYDYFYNKMTPQEVGSVGTDTIYQTLTRTVPPYDEFDTVIVERITYRDITRVRFLEEWEIDRKTMEVSKNVVGIAPIYERGYENETYAQLMFWIFFKKDYPSALIESR
jgi:hypothetical protein